MRPEISRLFGKPSALKDAGAMGNTRDEPAERIFSEAELFLASMARSKKGNLWRRLDDGRNVTVFKDQFCERFLWCIASGRDDVVYSPDSYDTELGAVEALLEELDRDEE